RARGRPLRHLALWVRVQRVVPLLQRGDAEPLDLLRVIDETVGLERGADPEAVLVLERDGLRLADRRRDLLPQRTVEVELREQLLLVELFEECRLAAPEDVDLGLALPLDDAAVRDRRPRRK